MERTIIPPPTTLQIKEGQSAAVGVGGRQRLQNE